MKIKKIYAYEILNSRGLPTVECCLMLDNDMKVISSVPSGVSVSVYEAAEKRDGGKRYFGLGVLKACENINKKIAPLFIGKKPDFIKMDQEMIDLDGKQNKSNLGANAILAVSIAIIKAQALSEGVELYNFIAKTTGSKVALPKAMFNVLNGGLHASNGLCFQEFMVMPSKETSFEEATRKAVQIYQHLKSLLFDADHIVSVGDEGGFAPMFSGKNGIADLEAFDYLEKAIKAAGFNRDSIDICIDAAASHFFDEDEGFYYFHNHEVDADELIEFYETLVKKYSIYSIEDGLDQTDYQGWRDLVEAIGKQTQVVGDDLFATNCELIKGGIEHKLATSVLIKPNQIGTVSETLDAIDLCKKEGLKTIISNRSGETLDTFISDLTVGTGAEHFKGGGLSRGERIAKYNRLIEIERSF